MSSAEGPERPTSGTSKGTPQAARETVEIQLFESLVHHLVEKGVLTRNDALSVVQAVAQVKLGEQAARPGASATVAKDLILLERLYASFELITERPMAIEVRDGANVL